MIVGRSYARLENLNAAENQYDRAVTGVGSRWSGSDSDRARRPARGPGRKPSHRTTRKAGKESEKGEEILPSHRPGTEIKTVTVSSESG